jgi:NAD(P)-dependent dehydrogenase (short-subunit alcohol dehydrogenase family)
VSDPASIEGAALRLAEDSGGLDVLVNHAGIERDLRVAAADPAFEVPGRTLDTNVLGAYRLDGPTSVSFRDGRAIVL